MSNEVTVIIVTGCVLLVYAGFMVGFFVRIGLTKLQIRNVRRALYLKIAEDDPYVMVVLNGYKAQAAKEREHKGGSR